MIKCISFLLFLDLKIKDAAKLFGKKFSSGTSVGETATLQPEVTIQGDVIFQLPDILMKEYKVFITYIIILFNLNFVFRYQVHQSISMKVRMDFENIQIERKLSQKIEDNMILDKIS